SISVLPVAAAAIAAIAVRRASIPIIPALRAAIAGAASGPVALRVVFALALSVLAILTPIVLTLAVLAFAVATAAFAAAFATAPIPAVILLRIAAAFVAIPAVSDATLVAILSGAARRIRLALTIRR